jgi:hypothetical protein
MIQSGFAAGGLVRDGFLLYDEKLCVGLRANTAQLLFAPLTIRSVGLGQLMEQEVFLGQDVHRVGVCERHETFVHLLDVGDQ